MRCLVLLVFLVTSALAQDQTTEKAEPKNESYQDFGDPSAARGALAQSAQPAFYAPAQSGYAPAQSGYAQIQPTYSPALQSTYTTSAPALQETSYVQAQQTSAKLDEHVQILVPTPYPVTYERRIPVTINKPVPISVPRAVPIRIPQPYAVPIPRAVPVEVPRPVPVPQPYAVPYVVPEPYSAYTPTPVPATYTASAPGTIRGDFSFPTLANQGARFSSVVLPASAGVPVQYFRTPYTYSTSAYFGPQVIYNGSPPTLLAQNAVSITPKSTAVYSAPVPQNFVNVVPTAAPLVTSTPTSLTVTLSPSSTYDGPSHAYLPPGSGKKK